MPRRKKKHHRFNDLPTDLARRGSCAEARAAVRAMPVGIRKDYAGERVDELCAVSSTRGADLDRPRGFFGFGMAPRRQKLNPMERAAQGHANDWLRYSRSPQYQRDLEEGKHERAESDRKARHLPSCSLTRCAPGCSRNLGNLGSLPNIKGRKCPVREGTRVVFNPNPVSLMLYSHGTPRRGEQGTVTTVPLPGGRKPCLPGPGGGLIYVDWDEFGTAGIAPGDIDRSR
jgi:hypothetical protein